MSEESRKLMAVGKLPLRKIDMRYVPQTYYDYRDTTLQLLAIISKRLGRDVHMADFWKFATEYCVEPLQNIHLWLTEDVTSPTVR